MRSEAPVVAGMPSCSGAWAAPCANPAGVLVCSRCAQGPCKAMTLYFALPDLPFVCSCYATTHVHCAAKGVPQEAAPACIFLACISAEVPDDACIMCLMMLALLVFLKF